MRLSKLGEDITETLEASRQWKVIQHVREVYVPGVREDQPSAGTLPCDPPAAARGDPFLGSGSTLIATEGTGRAATASNSIPSIYRRYHLPIRGPKPANPRLSKGPAKHSPNYLSDATMRLWAIRTNSRSTYSPPSVLTLNCHQIIHAASALSRATRARLILESILAPSAKR